MKLLVLGGNGQVGHELRRSLAPLGEVVVTTRNGEVADAACEQIDLAELEAIAPLLDRVRPDVVVNATAYTAVDRAEEDAGTAFRANAEAPGHLARACAARDISLVHYSTDYLFDGSATRPYREDDPTCPLGVYGVSKLAGEDAIRTSGVRHLILRTAWVYGLYGHNFLRTMLRVGAERDELRVVDDQRGSPTPAWLIADVTATVLRHGIAGSGIRHLVAAGETTWHGFAEAIFEEAASRRLLARRPSVTPITTAEYPTPARRPAYSVLDTAALRDDYGVRLPEWRLALNETLDRAQST